MSEINGGLESVWTVADGLRVHARVSRGVGPEGDYPAVVLVHGLIVSGRYMIPTAERLAARYRVYVPDLPGFGGSEGPDWTLDVAGLSGSLDAWMRVTDLQSATLVGNSFGCQIVADLALRRPERVGCAVLLNPTMDPEARTAHRQVARFLLDVPREPLSFVPIMLGDYLAAGFGRAWRTFRYALEDRIEEKLPGVRAPTLVVRGERDPICPQRWAEEATRLLPNGRLVVIPGAAHTVNYGAPRKLARTIHAFLHDTG